MTISPSGRGESAGEFGGLILSYRLVLLAGYIEIKIQGFKVVVPFAKMFLMVEKGECFWVGERHVIHLACNPP